MSELAKLSSIDSAVVYSSSIEHLLDELARIEYLIRIRIVKYHQELRNQEEYAHSNPSHISPEEVLWLLSRDSLSHSGDTQALDHLLVQLEEFENVIDQRITTSLEKGVQLPLCNLAQLFNLNRFEIFTILIAIAPEVFRKYDRIYAYLQDDITRKRPSIDLILELLCNTTIERCEARYQLDENSSLRHFNLIETIEDRHSPSGSSDLATFVRLNQRIVNYLLGHNVVDKELAQFGVSIGHNSTKMAGFREISLVEKTASTISRFVKGYDKKEQGAVLIFVIGQSGIGKRCFVNSVATESKLNLIAVDCRALLLEPNELERTLSKLFLESVLMQSSLYFRNFECFQNEDEISQLRVEILKKKMNEFEWCYFASSTGTPDLITSEGGLDLIPLTIKVPNKSQRMEVWKQSLSKYIEASNLASCDESDLVSLVEQFELTPGQINEACKMVRDTISISDQEDSTFEQLLSSSREVSNRNLAKLSEKIPIKYNWPDIVLPQQTIDTLKSICNQVVYYSTVFGKWGFGEKLAYGRGLSVLFSGVPGTGKTMAAQVIANQLNLDLYKIDLSTVVSKYIGETEKNLSKVFGEAAASNAVLFFDEADALFGKRTEISDSHDRYANLEVSYLLQRMEEYDGIVILATNLRNNMDDAFVRRIRFIIDFPFPDKECRLRIWQKSFPDETPVSSDINFASLANCMTLSGGSIKNIALNAAFYAANAGKPISMGHLIRSAKIEYTKIGKLWDDNSMNFESRSR